MDFRLIVDKTAEENVTATVHAPNALTDELETLVRQYTGTDTLTGYAEGERRLLHFGEITCIYVEGGKTYAAAADGGIYQLRLRLYEAEQPAARPPSSASTNLPSVHCSSWSALQAPLPVRWMPYSAADTGNMFPAAVLPISEGGWKNEKAIGSFLHIGVISAGGGPVILAIVYLALAAQGVATTLSAERAATEILTSALMAFIAGGVSVVYRLERLPLFCATLIHGAALYADYLIVYLLNGWLPRRPGTLLLFTGIFLAAYAVIWLIVYLSIRRRVARLNAQLQHTAPRA